jgi:iron complex transport system ATP-binding protein
MPARATEQLSVPSRVPISCSDLSFQYLPGRPVLNGVSCAVHPARITALVGPNGAGKSTLLRLMAGLLTPSSGRVTLRTMSVSERTSAAARGIAHHGGQDVAHIAPPDRARHIAYVAQRSSIAFAFSARHVVAMGRHALGSDPAVVEHAIQMLDLGPVADRPFNTLSAGQQQRVSIARAVAQLTDSSSTPPSREPRFLLADEPLAALDPRHIVQSLDTFRALADRGIGIVLVLHDLTAAGRIADDAILLNCGGTVGASGPAAAVLTPDILGPAYGVRFASLPIPGNPPALIPIAVHPPMASRTPERR